MFWPEAGRRPDRVQYFFDIRSHPEYLSRLIILLFILFARRCLSCCNCQSIMVAFKGIWTKDFWRAVFGEFLATLIFVLLGLGSTINWAAGQEKPPPADLVLISLCFGLSIATMVQCFGHISGGHINPAVTVAMVVTRKLSLAKAVFYVVAQCLGAITGACIIYLVTPAAVRGPMGVTSVRFRPLHFCVAASRFHTKREYIYIYIYLF